MQTVDVRALLMELEAEIAEAERNERAARSALDRLYGRREGFLTVMQHSQRSITNGEAEPIIEETTHDTPA